MEAVRLVKYRGWSTRQVARYAGYSQCLYNPVKCRSAAICFANYLTGSNTQGTNKNQGVQAPKHPTKLPRGTDTEIRIRIVAGIAVDVETARVEVANVDEAAVGRLHA